MITAGILYLGALLLGYLGAPHIAGTVAYVLAGALLVALLGFAIRIVVSLPGRRRAGQSLVPSVGLLALTAALVVVIVLLAVIDLST
ncbi:hypothetical protein B7R54_07490 [Subtercola boreus]|uniref:Uncharacterized protein n=1 Tax=Subtercola boreus TaxID=120213 RepID=A0A3E0VHG8_9MICO|nr:hypothetical protein [Subtercola boreus]RFA09085.1 hypothetical protein B7R54_07490 [Subtercola boreus]TQL53911.1 hypothetical protein FB464_1430 [Subtercola boreus]